MSATKAGRTVAEILADPTTPKSVASLMQSALMEWERHERAQRALARWAMEGREIMADRKDA